MDHGHVISATVAPAHYTHVEPMDVTATVAHIVGDDFLFELFYHSFLRRNQYNQYNCVKTCRQLAF